MRRAPHYRTPGGARFFVAIGLVCGLFALAGARGARGAKYDLGLTVGSAIAIDGGERFDSVFDDNWQEFGLGLSIRGASWSLELAGTLGEFSGFETFEISTGPEAGPVQFEYLRLDVTVARAVRLGERWSLVTGLGPSAFARREENPLVDREATTEGAHFLLALDRRAGPWNWRFALGYLYVADGSDVWDGFHPVGSDDLGITSFTVSPRRVLKKPESREIDGARWSLRAQLVGVYPTFELRQVLDRVSFIEAEGDSTLGVGVGAAVWLAGPLRLAVDLGFAQPTLRDRVVYPGTNTTFHASGEIICRWG